MIGVEQVARHAALVRRLRDEPAEGPWREPPEDRARREVEEEVVRHHPVEGLGGLQRSGPGVGVLGEARGHEAGEQRVEMRGVAHDGLGLEREAELQEAAGGGVPAERRERVLRQVGREQDLGVAGEGAVGELQEVAGRECRRGGRAAGGGPGLPADFRT